MLCFDKLHKNKIKYELQGYVWSSGTTIPLMKKYTELDDNPVSGYF